MTKSTRVIEVVELTLDELNFLMELRVSDWEKYGITGRITNSKGHEIRLAGENFYREVVVIGID